MRIHAAQRTVKSSGLENVHTTFKIKQNAKMFKLLSDQMYSNKPKAILREIYANAVDAHVEAGTTDIPIIVVLPTDFKSVLTIKDFGTGISHIAIMTLFSTYGETTKDGNTELEEDIDADMLIGGLGIGSKSPFSYTDSFTVESRYNGELRTYTAYIGSNGEPAITMMGEARPTAEPNGLTYQIPIKPEDVNDFREEAQHVFKYFKMVPDIKSGGNFEIDTVDYEIENDVFAIVTHPVGHSYRTGWNKQAVMGNIAYPLDFAAVKTSNDRDKELVDFFSYNRISIDMFFDIGELDVTASREALSYDEETQKAILAKLKVIRDTVLVEVEAKLATTKTKWAAQIMLASLAGTLTIVPTEQCTVNWNGSPINIRHDICYDKLNGTDDLCVGLLDSFDFRKKTLKLTNCWIHKHTSNKTIATKNTRVIRINRDEHRIPSRLLRWVNEKWGDRKIDLLVIHTDDDAAAEYYTHQILGNPKVYDFATDVPDYSVLERRERKKNGTVSKATGLSLFSKHSYNGGVKSFWSNKEDSLDLDTNTGYYVDIRNYCVWYNGVKMDPSILSQLVKQAQSLDIVDDDIVIYGVNGSSKNNMTDHKNWTNFIDHLHIKARMKYMKTDKSKDSMAKDNYDALLADNLSSTVCHLDVEEIEASSSDSLWTKAQKIYEDGRNISTENVPYKILLRLQQYFDMTFIKKVVKEDGKTSQKINLDEQYPILQCIDRWRTDHKLITDYINERDYLISIGLSKLKGN